MVIVPAYPAFCVPQLAVPVALAALPDVIRLKGLYRWVTFQLAEHLVLKLVASGAADALGASPFCRGFALHIHSVDKLLLSFCQAGDRAAHDTLKVCDLRAAGYVYAFVCDHVSNRDIFAVLHRRINGHCGHNAHLTVMDIQCSHTG